MDFSTQFAWYMTASLGLVMISWVVYSFVRNDNIFLGVLSQGGGEWWVALVSVVFIGGLVLYVVALMVLFGDNFITVSYAFRSLFVMGCVIPPIVVGFISWRIGRFVEEAHKKS